VLGIDCTRQPQQFLSQLDEVRFYRREVGSSVLKIEDVFKQQREIIISLRSELEKIHSAVLEERN
jgi:hypothetical protein